MKKKILIIAATHGDEKIGTQVIARLKKRKLDVYFDFLVANQKAFKKNVRFVDFDLNRAYPGDKYSKLYEKRRASEILLIAQRYQYVIDIHEAKKGINNFHIIPQKKIINKRLLELTDLNTVLLWPDPKGPLGQVLDNIIELEFGMKGKSREKIVSVAVKIAEKIIKRVYQIDIEYSPSKKVLYYVYGKLMVKDAPKRIKLKDFKKAKVGKEIFYPLLVGQYPKEGILCYKMRLI
jgi:predicted deacylase